MNLHFPSNMKAFFKFFDIANLESKSIPNIFDMYVYNKTGTVKDMPRSDHFESYGLDSTLFLHLYGAKITIWTGFLLGVPVCMFLNH